ncbi:unnamed protein product [Didymodactylos carnosus]|uniref:Uncharacterized protein n=1 Tax=Didymodactylos carnosus TaxID=1234261 RepID=A0A8S2H2W1_9BILA|nr:unnamed protein product [Didymodactylos carnosus]CAF3590991.1 unnamed protein product [Didymodactylos carnosus]
MLRLRKFSPNPLEVGLPENRGFWRGGDSFVHFQCQWLSCTIGYFDPLNVKTDRLCEGIETQQKLQEFYARENGRNATLKRHNTNHSHLNLDMDEDLNDYDNDEVNNDFQQVNYGRPRKKFVNRNEIDERIIVRTITNSNMNMNSNNNRSQQQNLHRQQQKSNNNNNANNNNNNQTITISSQALKYAAENHLQPIRIEYKDGDLNGVTKQIDLYVYLCDLKRYPNEVDKIKLTPHPSRHLPPQRSTLLKWVKNSVSLNEVKEEFESKFKSIYSVEDIIGTKNNRNRHIRIDFSDEREYIDVLNSGKISLLGQLYDIDEYLPAPKLLFVQNVISQATLKKYVSILLLKSVDDVVGTGMMKKTIKLAMLNVTIAMETIHLLIIVETEKTQTFWKINQQNSTAVKKAVATPSTKFQL